MTQDEICQTLVELKFATSGELQEAIERLPGDRRSGAATLLKELVRAGKLTGFQAKVIYRGKGRELFFGTYLIEDRLGRGGFGTVYRAQHRLMGRTVAIKVINPELIGNRDALDRFLVEMRTAAKLEHPNIVKAYDADRYQGSYYLAMEFVPGRLLIDVVNAGGPLPLETAVDYIIQTARGLDYAHAQGVIHRDIKPSNLILDREGRIRILDLGLARFDKADERGYVASRMGLCVGTRDYMAPEQAIDAQRADHRSDIYSLGCTLYSLLAGKVMYPGLSEAKKMVDHLVLPAPNLIDSRPETSPELEAVYHKMVARHPRDRFQTMAEVLEALEPFLVPAAPGATAVVDGEVEDIPVSLDGTPPLSQRATARLPWWRRRAAVGGLVACCSMIGLIAGVLSGTLVVTDVSDAGTPNRRPAETVAAANGTNPPSVSRDAIEVDDIHFRDERNPSAAVAVREAVTKQTNFAPSGTDTLHHFQFERSTGANVSLVDGVSIRSGMATHALTAFGHTAQDSAGRLEFVVTEDATQTGPDGRPGVISLKVIELPDRLKHLGFSILGPQKRFPITDEKLGAIGLADLAKTTLQFSHRAVRPAGANGRSLKFGCRLEPEAIDPNAVSLRLSAFEPTDRWQTCTQRLSTGTNLDVCLDHLNRIGSNRMKLTIDSADRLSLLPGDMLLIDDVKIIAEP